MFVKLDFRSSFHLLWVPAFAGMSGWAALARVLAFTPMNLSACYRWNEYHAITVDKSDIPVHEFFVDDYAQPVGIQAECVIGAQGIVEIAGRIRPGLECFFGGVSLLSENSEVLNVNRFSGQRYS